jgi:hypothetical protein
MKPLISTFSKSDRVKIEVDLAVVEDSDVVVQVTVLALLAKIVTVQNPKERCRYVGYNYVFYITFLCGKGKKRRH